MEHQPLTPQSAACSIALCTYNGEKYLPQLLDSILSQTVLAREIIIVDDCSTDGTVSILEKYAGRNSQIKLSLQKSNLGPVAAFQTAIQLTSQPYIFLADQDDIWNPNKVELMLSAASRFSTEKPLLVYSDLEVVDERGNPRFPSFWKMAGIKPHTSTFERLMYGNVVTGCASLINAKMKECLTSIPQGVLMHDHWIGLIAYGFGETLVLDEQLVKYRTHGDSVTEKRQANALWKLQTQLAQLFKESGTFLEKEINQMILFDQKFRNHLSDANQKLVKKFISLKNKPLLIRKLVSYLR